MSTRYDYSKLIEFANRLLIQSGMDENLASDISEILVEGDLLGKTTHGLQLLSPYLKNIQEGKMKCSGNPEIKRQGGGVFALDGRYLPGPFLVRQAVNMLLAEVSSYGSVTATIQRSHHIACLQAYLKPVTDAGYMMLLATSDPSTQSVAPFGGISPVFTPNPFAVGIPTEGEPILIDISSSITTNGQSLRLHKKGEKFSSKCLQSADGEATNDPAVLFEDPPGTILPLGGVEFGHKGFALAILIEALTSGLSGYGRSDEPDQWGASVFIQLINPEFFGGNEFFKKEASYFSGQCRDSKPRFQEKPVKMPGDRAMKLRQDQLENGVELHPAILPSLSKWADKFDMPLPEAIR